jgi:predicted NBD/HSP70 family sugar kinase
MPYAKKLEQYQIALTNKYNVFRCIRKGPINRAAIARELGLSIPTVMAIVDDFLQKGVICSVGKGKSRGKPQTSPAAGGPSVGKQPEIVALEPDQFFYIGCDMGRSAIRIVMNNAAGVEVASTLKPTGDTVPEKDFISQVRRFMLQFVKKFAPDPTKVLGSGVAMPALIERGSGKVIIAPDFGWKDIPLQDWLQQGVSWPILVKNSSQALAVNESFLSSTDEIHTTLCVNLGYGIGAAIITGEDLYDGAGGISGELGHCVVDRDGPLCKCGNIGCLEAVSSGEAIARQAQTIVSHHTPTKMAEFCGGNPAKIDAKMVFEAAEVGDVPALKIISTAGMYIGIGISMAINIIDPDRVVLCGGLMRNGPSFLELIKSSMEEHLITKTNRKLIVTAGSKDEYSTAKGAAMVLLNSLWARRALPI